MNKLDELRRTLGGNAADSLAHGPAPAIAVDPDAGMPERLKGLVKSKNTAEIPVDKIIHDPDQPREEFDEEALDRLAESLKDRGVLQPLRVRWDESMARYVLIAGERRWRAAAKAGLPAVPCVIHEGPIGSGELLALQLIENLLREDLKPIEQARGYRRLMETNDWSANRLAKELHLPGSTVARALELLDLPAPVQDLVEQGTLPPATACEIGRLGDHRAEDQIELARQTAEERLTRAAVVEAVKAKKVGQPAPAKAAKAEYRLDDGHKVSVTGSAVETGPEAVIEVLRRLIKKLQAEARAQKSEAA